MLDACFAWIYDPFMRGVELDTVVSALVLCSVDDLQSSLHEIARVLRPGGRLLYIDERRPVRLLQRMVEPLWKIPARGCHLTRDTEQALLDAGFELIEHDRSALPGGFLLVEAAIHGIARRSAIQ